MVAIGTKDGASCHLVHAWSKADKAQHKEDGPPLQQLLVTMADVLLFLVSKPADQREHL